MYTNKSLFSVSKFSSKFTTDQTTSVTGYRFNSSTVSSQCASCCYLWACCCLWACCKLCTISQNKAEGQTQPLWLLCAWDVCCKFNYDGQILLFFLRNRKVKWLCAVKVCVTSPLLQYFMLCICNFVCVCGYVYECVCAFSMHLCGCMVRWLWYLNLLHLPPLSVIWMSLSAYANLWQYV